MGLALLLGASWLAAPRAEAASYRIELITTGAGDALWSAFGHTALRVVDEDTEQSRIYNYGVANFGDPGFLWGFMRGRSTYRLAVFTWYDTLFSAMAQDRTLYRQVLNLTPAQAAELAAFLEWNALPENAEYYYDHLMDNCATRVRDALDAVTGGALREAAARWSMPWTYRHYTLAATVGRLHFLLGIDLMSGPNQAQVVDGWASMYLPEFVMRAVGEAVIDEWRGLPLAQEPIVVYERRAPPAARGGLYTGRWVFVGVALGFGLLCVLVGRRSWQRPAGWLGRLSVRGLGVLVGVVAVVFGLLGTMFLVLGIVSKVPDTHWNENAWVFWPLDFWLLAPAAGAVWGARWRVGRWLGRYLVLRAGLLMGYAWLKPTGLFPQDNWAFLFGVVAILVAVRVSSVARAEVEVRAPASAAEGSAGGEPLPSGIVTAALRVEADAVKAHSE
jgi:hypothetical protein